MRQTIHVMVTYLIPTSHPPGQQTRTTHLYLVSSWSIRGAITSLHILHTVVLSILLYGASSNLDCRPSPTCAIDTFWDVRASGIGFRCGRMYIVYILYKGIQLKTKLHRPGAWSAAGWPPRRVRHRPTVFFHHVRLIALSLPQGKIRRCFKNCHYFSFLCPFRIFLSVKLCDRELCREGEDLWACVVERYCDWWSDQLEGTAASVV
jgi:hypothetical protein